MPAHPTVGFNYYQEFSPADEAVDQAMRGLDEAMRDLGPKLEGLEDLPFGLGHEPRRRRRAEWRQERQERRDMHDTLKALERGEIDVDEAMSRLDE